MIATTEFTVNGRAYAPPPLPAAVICFDGCGDEYLDAALAHGRMPNLARMAAEGYRGMVRGALPSFTNVNNASICTGVPPAVHGISGNFFLDPETGEELMMNSARFLRAETILAAAARAGRRVAMATAKDKLRDILSAGLEGIAFSAERAGEARAATHGIDDVESIVGAPTPPIYSPEASLFVLQAGAALLERGLADLLYLSLTDYMQHKYEPQAPESLDFHERVDRQLGRLLAAGAVVGLTADHGMNAKQRADGSPNVIYLETELHEQFGPGAKVILPITDPYVVHHGALGSLAMVYLGENANAEEIARWLLLHVGVTEVYDRRTAAIKLELPADRIGDLVVLSGRDVVLGRKPEDHDLSNVAAGLRSHGGRYEEMVPMVLSHPLREAHARRAAADPRNFEIFDFTLNGTQD